MTISVNSVFKQNRDGKSEGQNPENLKELFEAVLKEKNEYSSAEITWLDDETVEVSNISGLSLHSFVLRAEELGKNISYQKKTIIKITD